MTPADASAVAESWLELPDGRLFWLKNRCAIGRQPDNDLVLETTALSRHHALIARGPAGYTLTDLHSSNGTYLNREAVTRSAVLRDADEIRFGDLVVRYRCTRRMELGPASAAPDFTRRIDDVRELVCWLLVVDVAGYSTLIGQIGSEAALRRLQTWIGDVRPLIEQNAGRINSYVGDAIFAWWPGDTCTPANVRATLAALEGYRARSPLAFRVVAHHGPVLFMRSERGEELSGQEVNFIFRSEKIAKQFGSSAMLSAASVHALQLADRCPALGSSPVDGIEGQFVFHALPPDFLP
jgi:class 3 adenylate cyclase